MEMEYASNDKGDIDIDVLLSMDKQEIIDELFEIINDRISKERDDYSDGIVDGILIAIKMIDSHGQSVGKKF